MSYRRLYLLAAVYLACTALTVAMACRMLAPRRGPSAPAIATVIVQPSIGAGTGRPSTIRNARRL